MVGAVPRLYRRCTLAKSKDFEHLLAWMLSTAASRSASSLGVMRSFWSFQRCRIAGWDQRTGTIVRAQVSASLALAPWRRSSTW